MTERSTSPAAIRARGRVEPPPVGALVGGVYRIEAPIGTGSAGLVFRALDERLHRPVAIKWVRPDAAADVSAEQFLLDARAMARVTHSNVVSIYAFGVHEGMPYLVMEYVPGRTLAEWIEARGSRPSVREAVAMVGQICSGVQAIHDVGVIHGDLKPTNILVGEDQRVAVTDLGISRFWDEGPSGAPIAFTGSPHYLAPEKLTSRPRIPNLMARADIYSLGVVAYRLLTGQLPFDDASAGSVMRQQIYRAPERPSQVRSGLPDVYDRPILRALSKDPRERYASPRMFWAALAKAHEAAHPAAERILLVDDDDEFRGLAALCLQQAFPTAELVECSDGRSGLEALAKSHFELAVVDLQMPGMDGLELTEAIRTRPETRDLPILVVTGRGGAADWKRLSALGADSFMVKPLEPTSFMQAATRLVDA